MGAGGLASIVFGLIVDAFGDASFNAIGTITFSIAGACGDDDTLMSTAVRFPAQAIGAAGGVMSLLELMPLEYKHLLEGPTQKVDLHTGAIAEGVLTFVITFVVLLIIIKGPNSLFLKNWMLSMATMVVILVGSSYTGPSMNPANIYNSFHHLYFGLQHEALNLCKSMMRRGECPPLMVVFDPVEG
ncbi:unnamed protein product [Lactuca virosa]|uniref:Uncharacterized protein n=1 Tax=Lactuca virosa TaxID=75947 RepID=A0AAU9LQN7_9ASTR|nr:unnamed protein product [Lactuca virosa]